MKAAVSNLLKHGSSRATKQRGVVMFVALAVLILMTLAGLAMLRQMGGSVSIAGNLAFKQNATSVADIGTETALAFLRINTTLQSDQPAAGYYSSWHKADVDPASYFVAPAAPVTPPTFDAGNGNSVSYVIHRLCELPNLDANAPTQHCSRTGVQKPGNSGYGGNVYGANTFAPYFRVTTRVTGPRNTVSYIQVVLD
jgi:type IV pilus assembly protein PilX